MKIVKNSPHTKTVYVHLAEGESKAWRWATLVFAVAALLAALSGCASAPPPDIAALQEENALLRQLLDECEADAQQCMDLLIECEGERTK